MNLLVTALAVTLLPLGGSPQGLSAKRDAMLSEVLITTLSAADLEAAKTLEHDSEVAKNEMVTIVGRMPSCQKDAKGACNASADIVTYTPDGNVHSETKGVSLTTGRGTTALKLAPADVTGVYKVIATVRDLTARSFGTTERRFGVK